MRSIFQLFFESAIVSGIWMPWPAATDPDGVSAEGSVSGRFRTCPAKDAPEDKVSPNSSTLNDEMDGWPRFGKALSREQSAYLRKKMESTVVKRDFDMEERINMLSNEMIGDSVLDNGEIVEDYLEDLERLFDE